jgi:hypothetical protein
LIFHQNVHSMELWGEAMNRIYDELQKQGSIVPEPLIILAVAISFPMVVLGSLVERTIRWMFWKEER